MKKGADVSHWQSKINWATMKAQGIEFAFIKATEGGAFLDDRFYENWENSKAAGIPRGAYHYYTHSVHPKAQAKHFVDTAARTGDLGELALVMDLEERKGMPLPSVLAANVKMFLDEAENLSGKIPMVYTSPGFWGWGLRNNDLSWAKRLPLWIAHWGVPAPAIPAPWDSYTVWQYTVSKEGSKYGTYSKGLDLDCWNGEIAVSQPVQEEPRPETPPAFTAFSWPIPEGYRSAKYITQWYGDNPQDYKRYGLPGHDGLDFGTMEGTPIYSAIEGKITASGSLDEYGQAIKVSDGRYATVYGHLSKRLVSSGYVRAGQLIGYSGSTGRSSGPHLHFGVWDNGSLVDPWPLLNGRQPPAPAADPGVKPPEKQSGTARVETAIKVRSRPDTTAGLIVGMLPEGLSVQVFAAKQVGNDLWAQLDEKGTLWSPMLYQGAVCLAIR